MFAAITIILCAAIISGAVSFCIYMYYCSENEVGMFADPRYLERINELEDRVDVLEDKVCKTKLEDK